MNQQKELLTNYIQKSVQGCAKNWAETIAEYLLDTGVIVPPVKVGQKVFCVYEEDITSANILAVYVDVHGGMFDMLVRTKKETPTGYISVICKDFTFDDFGTSIFLSYEDAKKALEGED